MRDSPKAAPFTGAAFQVSTPLPYTSYTKCIPLVVGSKWIAVAGGEVQVVAVIRIDLRIAPAVSASALTGERAVGTTVA